MRFSLAHWCVPLACVALLVPNLVSARVSDANTGLSASGRAAGLSTACSGSSATECIATLLGRVLNILFGFLGILLLGYILYGGFVWMTAGGNGKDVEQARTIIRNAVIGVIVIASSFAISDFVLKRLAEIAGLSGTNSSGTSAGNGSATYDQLMDGSLRPCCYANPTPMVACTRDCVANPTAFGLTGPATEDACILPCGSRICTAGDPSDPGPVPGQQRCTPGNPTGGQATGGTGLTTPTAPVYNRAAFCQSLDAEAATLNPASLADQCRICANGCLGDICAGQLPPGMPGAAPPLVNTTQQQTLARTRCENEVCTVQCRIGY